MTVETLKQAHGSLTESANRAYREAVIATARGEEVNDLETIHACSAIGKSVADFERDVDRVRARFAAAADLTEADALDASVPPLAQAATAAREKFDEVQAETKRQCDESREAWLEEKRKVDSVRQKARGRRVMALELLRSGADPAFDEQITQKRNRIANVLNSINRAHHPGPRHDPDPRMQEDAAHRAEIDRLEAEIRDLEAQKVHPVLGLCL